VLTLTSPYPNAHHAAKPERARAGRRHGAEAVGGVEAVRAVAHPAAVPPGAARRRRQPRRGLPGLPRASPRQGRRRRRHRRRPQPVQVRLPIPSCPTPPTTTSLAALQQKLGHNASTRLTAAGGGA